MQCAGQDVKDGHGHFNYWWVLIHTHLGRGWVSAVRIAEGGNNEPIEGVDTAATVYEFPGTDVAPPHIHVVSGGAAMYLGGSTRSEPPYEPISVPPGSYPAFAQCGGEDVELGG